MYRKTPLTTEQEIARIRTPREGEIFGIALEMMGGSKIRIECEDEKIRLCRIPGRLKRRIWVRVGDLVLVKPWVVQTHERADIVWRYTRTQANWLKRQNMFTKIQYG